MIKVKSEVRCYDDANEPKILVSSHWNSQRLVVVEVDGKKYNVLGRDLITAVENAMRT